MSQQYTSDHIQNLQFPDSVRRNASMYLGSTDEAGRWLVARELLDNGLDEFLAGRNDRVEFYENDDLSYVVIDNGYGIPQGTKEFTIYLDGKAIQSTIPTMQAVFGQLNTSGKYRTDAYRVSIGAHGIGSKGSNATSEFFHVITNYQGKWYEIRFEKGHLTTPVRECKAPKHDGKTLRKGTYIHFKHDKEIFGQYGINFDLAKSWAEITSYLNPKFKVKLRNKSGEIFEYYSEKGPSEYVDRIIEELDAVKETQTFTFKNDLCDVVIAFSNADSSNLRGYTNGLFNSDGGKHVDSACLALFNAVKPYAKAKQTVQLQDFREGLVGIINMHLHKAEFSSQDKLKLTDERAGDSLRIELEAQATEFFKKNKSLAMRLCEKSSKLSALRQQFKASKKMIAAINQAKKRGMPSKYSPFDSKSKLEDRELLIVEGLSAAGGLRQVRQPYQSLLPLKGKIYNALKADDAKILESDEIINILSAIGYDPNKENPISSPIVSKIICLADGDADGEHINTLLLSLFYKFCPELYEKGMIYVADMYDYYATHKNNVVVGSTVSEVKEKLRKINAPASIEVSHIKGWGEINASLMKVLAVDKKTRRLIRIKPISDNDRVTFVRIMNEDVEYRRKMLGLADNV